MEKEYTCKWCDHKFKKEVAYKGRLLTDKGKVVDGRGKKSALSTQVVCPNCARNIPTWEKIKTGNLVGRKHVHFR